MEEQMAKTINIGPWDGEQPQIQVEDNATLSDALQMAGLSLAASQQINTLTDPTALNLGDGIIEGETYLLTSTDDSGC